MSLDPVNDVWVGLRFDDETLPVGHLTLRTVAGRGAREILFEYDTGFIQRGIDISPLECRLEPGWRSFKSAPFKGLPGVFADSLPDGWGHWLLDAEMKQRGIDPSTLTPLDRLCHVGDCGMGALVYAPIRADPRRSAAVRRDTR